MTRLNQSCRQKIGYLYNPQVQNDITIQTPLQLLSVVQEKSFTQNMRGEGISDMVRGIVNEKKKFFELTNSDEGKELFKATKAILPSGIKKAIKSAEKPIQDIGNVVRASDKVFQKNKEIRNVDVKGGTIDIKGNNTDDILPGDMLRKKLLKKMVREKKMKSLGDRVKTSPLKGGSLVIPGKGKGGSPGGQSMSKTLPGMKKGYKLNPKPLVGAGQKGGFLFLLPWILSGPASLLAAGASASAPAIATAIAGISGSAIASSLATGAASATGAIIARKIAGDGIKTEFMKKVKGVKLSLKDLSVAGKIALKKALTDLRKDPTPKKLIVVGKTLAPYFIKAVATKASKELMKSKGGELNLAGAGLSKKAVISEFTKVFTKEITKKRKQ
tara:strand:+ start:1819 stop:2976 length:1158 start_codon:yes stop_codon:yes gene_type:complete